MEDVHEDRCAKTWVHDKSGIWVHEKTVREKIVASGREKKSA